mgnify:FL=1
MKNLFKKAMITMCSAVMLMGISVVGVNAATVEVGDFTIDRSYSYESYTTKVKSYNGKGGDIILPTEAEFSGTTYTITEVGSAFKDNDMITGVTIPEGYTDIGTEAFSGCTALKKAVIPGSVNMISTSAFLGCTALDTVDFAKDTASSLTINAGAFANCTSLTAIKLPARFSSTRYNFLYGCDALTSITLKEGAQNFAVSDNILYNVSGDTAVMVTYPGGKTETEFTIPAEINGKAVTSTAMHVFRNNPTLKKLTVPATVTSLGGYTFNGMKAIEEIILEHETAPKFGSSVCTEMNSGSRIIVKNDDVAKAFESTSSYTKYYTPENTTITVAGAEPEVKTVSAAVSIEKDKITGGKAVYNIYLDSAENVSTVILKASFDLSKVDKGEIIANDKFTSGTSAWKEENGKLVLKAYMGITGNVTGFTSTEKTKLAQISVPLKDGAKGNITAEILSALAAGVVSEDESAMDGTVTIGTASASIFVPSYDVNGDNKVDIVDITEAQRYYQAKSTDANWEEKAKAMDVNGDNKVDIQDYIDIFNNLSDF